MFDSRRYENKASTLDVARRRRGEAEVAHQKAQRELEGATEALERGEESAEEAIAEGEPPPDLAATRERAAAAAAQLRIVSRAVERTQARLDEAEAEAERLAEERISAEYRAAVASFDLALGEAAQRCATVRELYERSPDLLQPFAWSELAEGGRLDVWRAHLREHFHPRPARRLEGVLVRILKQWQRRGSVTGPSYMPGETAGFTADVAEQLIADGLAERVEA